jgi:hypothetical protein
MEAQVSMMSKMADKAYKQALKFDWSSTAQRTMNFLIKNN